MLPPPDRLKTVIERELPGISVTVEGTGFRVQPHDVVRLCHWLKTSPDYQLDYVANVTAVDYPADRMEMVYHLYSMAQKHGPVTLKVTLPRSNPAIESLTKVYRGAEFQEREVYDLFGVTFEGHPDLRRILMWEGFAGHPMRKDYVPENQDLLEERQT